ncbi:MAG: hypothetical protein ISS69_15630 [Phycisphaerae bacterium]|nr:hypothetical protein [Phycisphaerae bacterium]
MKRLPKIRAGLARLRLFRSTVRLGVMGSTVLSVLLWAMAIAFLLDFWIHMGQLERTIVLLGVIGTAVWAFVRFLVPALKVHETETALAVMVDGMHGMHSDIVGAIQFDDENRLQYGSKQLRDAVVEYTGQAAGELNFLEGFSRKELFNRMLVFVITAVICLVPAVVYSKYTGAFLKRMVLFEARYPTQTSIEIVSPTPDHMQAEGEPVKFVVRARHVSGPSELPKSGTVEIEALTSGMATSIELKRRGQEGDDAVLYSGTLNSVLDHISYTVYLGDTQSKTRQLKLVPRPRVELDMKIVTPKYVRGKTPPKPKNRRQAIVVEGSKIIPVITCDNKEIVSGTITFEKSASEKTTSGNPPTPYPLTRRGKTLVLDRALLDPSGKDKTPNPLASVTEMVRFEIDVTDSNNQHPESPVKGVVHIAADLPPRAALMGYSRHVVPGATPALMFRTIDDYALDEITLHLAIMDADGQQTDLPVRSIAKPRDKEGNRVGTWGGSYTVDLGKMKLQKGYQVSAFIEAVDYRGDIEGKSRRSEKWVFEITDDVGVLEAMDRLTEQMDKKLDEILRAQLEAGK